MFSKACEYGIRAVVHIARQTRDGSRIGLKEIAAGTDVPQAFIAKILQQLVHNQVISSHKGPHGGFYVEPEQLTGVTLFSIVRAIDGDSLFTGCGLGLKECSEEHPCPLHFQFREVRDGLTHILRSTSLMDMIQRLDSGLGFLRT